MIKPIFEPGDFEFDEHGIRWLDKSGYSIDADMANKILEKMARCDDGKLHDLDAAEFGEHDRIQCLLCGKKLVLIARGE